MDVRRVWVAPDAVDRGARLLDVVRACAQTASLVHTRYFFTESFLAEKSRVNKRFMHWCGQPTGQLGEGWKGRGFANRHNASCLALGSWNTPFITLERACLGVLASLEMLPKPV